jgi:hypothetical protein
MISKERLRNTRQDSKYVRREDGLEKAGLVLRYALHTVCLVNELGGLPHLIQLRLLVGE